jgi:transcriptional regulator with XRE-family HTH domain
MKINNPVGDNIRKYRAKMGLTQEGLALKSGLSQGYINQLENGKRKYTQKTLELIAEALRVNASDLLMNLTEEKSIPKNELTDTEKRKRFIKDLRNLLRDMPMNTLEHYVKLFKLEKELERRETGQIS